jgi:hypothetical protein
MPTTFRSLCPVAAGTPEAVSAGFFCCGAAGPCYKPAASITFMIQIINVIASINLEHDWPPENRFTVFGNHARVSRPDMMLSAGVAELVDALDLGSSDESCGGSSPSARTIPRSADDLTAERSAASTRRPHVIRTSESTACLSLALLFLRRRSGGTRGGSFGHLRRCRSHLVRSRRLLNWPALFFNSR